MRHKTPAIAGYAIVILAVAAAASNTTTEAHGTHTDRNIWIETAGGNFTTHNEHTPKDEVCKNIAEPRTTEINTVRMFNQEGKCGNLMAEVEYYQNNIAGKIDITIKEYHECVCGYWYSNTVKDEYTYTILDTPNDREIPIWYKGQVQAGVQAGLDRWADVNEMNMTYTDNRLEADIIIQQQIGKGINKFTNTFSYGNAEVGCLFNKAQCTIQLFTDLNIDNTQTLLNKQMIEWVTAHEFGHLIGLPHHIDPDNIMSTITDRNTRTYYETRNVNIPNMTEPTKTLLDEDFKLYLDILQIEQVQEWEQEWQQELIEKPEIRKIMENRTTIEYTDYILTILESTPQEDRHQLWNDIEWGLYNQYLWRVFATPEQIEEWEQEIEPEWVKEKLQRVNKIMENRTTIEYADYILTILESTPQEDRDQLYRDIDWGLYIQYAARTFFPPELHILFE